MREPPRADGELIEPTVRDAFIGELIGGVLIYAGWRIPYRIASWIVIGLGVLFILVMTAAIAVMGWQHASPHAVRLLASWRGHVRRDPLLGALTRNVKGRYWESTITLGNRGVDIVIEGAEEPLETLVHKARELVRDFDTLESRVSTYLASERTSGQWGMPSWSRDRRLANFIA